MKNKISQPHAPTHNSPLTTHHSQLTISPMDLQQQFTSAVTLSRELTSRPSNEVLLDLYALYKQATEGDVTGERPAGFDFKAIAKYDAWSDLNGKSKDAAMREYVELVDRLGS
ncbi:MAG: acyl-CoA-binding protein [Cyclobacteriaceae bacterium]